MVPVYFIDGIGQLWTVHLLSKRRKRRTDLLIQAVQEDINVSDLHLSWLKVVYKTAHRSY